MTLATDAAIMFISIVASTALAFFYNKQSNDRVAVGFLALALGCFNLVFVIRVSGLSFDFGGTANIEDVLFLMTAVFACIFIIIHFLKDRLESRYLENSG